MDGRVGALGGERWGAAAVAVASAVIGTTGAAHQLGPDGVDPVAAAAVRAAVGGVVLVACSARSVRWATVRRCGGPLAAGAIALAVLLPGFFVANDRLGVALGSVLAIGSGPLFAGVLEWLLGERPSPRWTVATGLAVAGGATMLAAVSAGETRLDPVGIVVGLVSGLGFGVFVVAVSRMIARGAASLEAITCVYALGSLPLVSTLAVDRPGWVVSRAGLVTAAYLGVVTVGVAYWLLAVGLARVSAATAATLSLAEPATATLAGVVVLGEPLPLWGWIGAGLVLVGVGLAGPAKRGGRDPWPSSEARGR